MRNFCLLPCCFLLSLLASDLLRANDNWPWWRGPSYNGVAADGQSPPTEWSSTQNVVWRADIPGRGHSSPTIVGNRIVLTTADEANQIQSVICFDRKTGDQLWKTDINEGGFEPEIHRKNSHATPTVAADRDRFFATFVHRNKVQVTALDYDGNQLWQKEVGSYAPDEFKFGYGPSPLVHRSSLIIASDFDGAAFLTAIERKSGKQIWRTKRPGKISWSSPVVAKVAGRAQLLLSGCNSVRSYDPKSGKELWSAEATARATCGTIVWKDDLVFASGGYPKKETACVRADGSGEVVWRNQQKCYEQSMLIYDGYLYAVTDDGIAFCWQPEDGKEMWKGRLKGPISASPVIANGNIYLSNEEGTTFVLRATPNEFDLVATNQLGSEAFATPTICSSQIFARVAEGRGPGRRESLYCLGE